MLCHSLDEHRRNWDLSSVNTCVPLLGSQMWSYNHIQGIAGPYVCVCTHVLIRTRDCQIPCCMWSSKGCCGLSSDELSTHVHVSKTTLQTLHLYFLEVVVFLRLWLVKLIVPFFGGDAFGWSAGLSSVSTGMSDLYISVYIIGVHLKYWHSW